MKKILLFTHNAQRDGCPDSLLKLELERLGHCVWDSTFLDEDSQKICTIKPDVVILPEIRIEYSESIASNCKKCGITVVVKMCEFGITEESLEHISEDYKTAIFGRFPTDHCVDLYLAWGPKMRAMMSEYMGIPIGKIAECGGYQFDQYFLPPPPALIKRSDKKTVLFAAGFAYADRNIQYSIPEAETGSPIHAYFVKKDQKNRGRFLELIKKFYEKHKDEWNVLVKPHAGERPDIYKSVLRGTGCGIVESESGFSSIQGIDFLVHSGSTMGFEAHLKNIPSINYANGCEDVIVSKVSPCCENQKSFFNTFSKITNKELVSTAPQSILTTLSYYYGDVDGRGNRRAAVAIDALPDRKATVPNKFEYPSEFKYGSENVHQQMEVWSCNGCKNRYYVTELRREMIKCPFCGIANVKIQQPKPETKNEEMREVCDAGHPPGANAQQGRCVSSVRKARKQKQYRLGTKKGRPKKAV